MIVSSLPISLEIIVSVSFFLDSVILLLFLNNLTDEIVLLIV